MLLEAAGDAGQPARPRARQARSLAAADMTFRDMVREAIRQRDKLTRWVDAAGGVPQAMAQLSQALGIEPDDTVEQVEAAIFDDSLIAASEWPAVAAALAAGSKTDQGPGRAVSRRSQRCSGTERLDTYLDIFCTGKRRDRARTIVTKAIQTDHPDAVPAAARRSSDRVCALLAAPARHRGARPQRRAVHHRPRGDRALPRREGPARPARLRRPDRQDARPAQQRLAPPGCTTSSTAASIMC